MVNNGSAEWRQLGFLGDKLSEVRLGRFSDADLAGDRADMACASGVCLALHGNPSFFLLARQNTKQTAVGPHHS